MEPVWLVIAFNFLVVVFAAGASVQTLRNQGREINRLRNSQVEIYKKLEHINITMVTVAMAIPENPTGHAKRRAVEAAQKLSNGG